MFFLPLLTRRLTLKPQHLTDVLFQVYVSLRHFVMLSVNFSNQITFQCIVYRIFIGCVKLLFRAVHP